MIGDIVSHYQILRKLGEGGMGEVFVGIDQTLGRKVALKAIRAERRLDAQAKSRFLREARILSALDHPHICRIYDYVEGEQCDLLVLELIDGRSLKDVIAHRPDRSLCMKIAEQVTDVLIAAHAAGVVHRDLKPGNIMLGDDGTIKVLDFGLARAIDSTPGTTTHSDPPPHHQLDASARSDDSDAPTVSDARPSQRSRGSTRICAPSWAPYSGPCDT